jgi:hypothetical protein
MLTIAEIIATTRDFQLVAARCFAFYATRAAG